MKAAQTVMMSLCLMVLFLTSAAAQEVEPADGEGVLLRLKYEEGEVLTYETKLEGVGSVHIAGQPQPVDMKGEMTVTMTVEGIDDEGNYTIVTEVAVRHLNVTVAGSPVPPPNQNMKVRTQVTPLGEITDVEVLEDNIPQARQRDLQAQMERVLTGGLDLRRMLMGQRIASFPEHPVSPGDEWTGTMLDVNVEGAAAPLEIRTKYDGNTEVAGVDTARLDSHFIIDASAFGEMATVLAMGGVTTADTRSWFDPEAGRMIASMERTQLTLRVNMPAELTGAPMPLQVMIEMFIDSQSKLLQPA